MPCIEYRLRATSMAMACAALLAGCGQTPGPASSPAPVVSAGPAAGRPPGAPSAPAPPPSRRADAPLPPPERARDWNHFKQLAALRLVAANRERAYDGPVPDPLLAIPVLEIELSPDGQVRHVRVLRHPTQARDTTQLAIDAVYRAGPFGSVRHLPQPWKFAEVFLFDDSRRFKPRTLDVD